MKLLPTSLIAGAVTGLLLADTHAQNPPRPNTFMLQSAQAGSTTDIDNLRVIDLDTGTVVYTNSFSSASDATNILNLFYYPQGGTETTNFVVNGSMTRVVSGKLRLETTGFGANGSGGYESHSEAEFAVPLPRNFFVDFDAIRLQWAGHFHFHLHYRSPSDAFSSDSWGGTYSTNRSPALRLDVLRMAASGSLFQQYGIVTNFAFPSSSWPIAFPAPAGSLLSTHRLGMSLSNSVARFYLDGVLLNSTNISQWISDEQISLIKAVKPAFSGLSVGTNYQLQVSSDLNSWTNQGAAFTATNASMIYQQYWDVENWSKLFFRIQRQ